jgi:hypothetical protein
VATHSNQKVIKGYTIFILLWKWCSTRFYKKLYNSNMVVLKNFSARQNKLGVRSTRSDSKSWTDPTFSNVQIIQSMMLICKFYLKYRFRGLLIVSNKIFRQHFYIIDFWNIKLDNIVRKLKRNTNSLCIKKNKKWSIGLIFF